MPREENGSPSLEQLGQPNVGKVLLQNCSNFAQACRSHFHAIAWTSPCSWNVSLRLLDSRCFPSEWRCDRHAHHDVLVPDIQCLLDRSTIPCRAPLPLHETRHRCSKCPWRRGCSVAIHRWGHKCSERPWFAEKVLPAQSPTRIQNHTRAEMTEHELIR